MKHIIDILNEMDGGSTPLNTVGMGDPMVPTEDHPGSEPIQPVKKKSKKKIKESILDDTDTIMSKGEGAAAIQWVKDNSFKWDPALDDQIYIKDGLIYMDNLIRLKITKDMPDYVQFGEVHTIDYALVRGADKNIKINLPQYAQEVTIANFSNYKIQNINIVSGKNPRADRLTFNGIIEHVNFPKDLIIKWLYMRDVAEFDLNNMEFPRCERFELSRKAVAEYIKSTFKLNVSKDFNIC